MLRIPWRLVVYVLLPLGMILSGVGWAVMTRLEKDLEASLIREVEVIGRSLQIPVGRAIEAGNNASIQETLDAVFRIGSVFGAFVYDAEGRLLVSAGRGGDDPGYRSFILEVLEKGEPEGTYARIDGRKVYSVFIPVEDVFSQPLGMIQINRDSREILSSMGNIRVRAKFLAIGVILLAAGVVLTGHYIAHGRGINQLAARIDRIERGERMIEASIQGPHEVAQLGHALNRMVASLDSAENEIRERKAVEAILREQADRNDRLIELGKLTGGIAHEIGAPLSVILGLVRRLRRQLDEKVELEGYLPTMDRIENEVRRTETIVREMLDFGHGRRTAIPCQLNDIIQRAVESAQPELQQFNCEVSIETQGEISKLRADPFRLALALRNLLSNSARHAPGSAIRVRSMFDSDSVAITIRDFGEGLPEHMDNRIFQPFVSTEKKGHGLGLAFVQQVISEHRGIVRAVSLSDGAEFRIRIPLKQPTT